MSVELTFGDLLSSKVDALVNPVNAVGVMGKGLALHFKQMFPDCYVAYRNAVAAGEVKVGRMHVVHRSGVPRIIFNFPTKDHWRRPSRIEYVRDGLSDLVAQVRITKIKSIAVPALGCGNGGLDWDLVRPLIVEALGPLGDVKTMLFCPMD